MERVVVSGIGLVTPCGVGTAETFANVVQGKSGIRTITLFDTTGHSTTIAGEVPDFDAEKFIPRKKLKEMGRFAHLAVAASMLAWKEGVRGNRSASGSVKRGRSGFKRRWRRST